LKIAFQVIIAIFMVLSGIGCIAEKDLKQRPYYLVAFSVMALLVLIIQLKWR